jgi:predicted metalloprotease with PDZ domain
MKRIPDPDSAIHQLNPTAWDAENVSVKRTAILAFARYQPWGLLIVLAFASHVSIAQCALTSKKSPRSMTYSFEPVFSGDKLALRVTLEFKGGRSGETRLEVPSSYAGQQHLASAFTELKALSSQTTLRDTSSAANKILNFPVGTTVRLSYLLIKDWSGPLNSDTRFRPILEREHFQLLSDTALIKPKLDYASTQDVYFDWQKLPASWSLASSFGVDDRCQSFHGAWKDFETALFVGGDYRIQRATISGNALILATRGQWSFTDDEWARQVQRIIETERNFWHDNSFPYQLVTLAPFDQDAGSYGGSAYTNAFMMHLPRKATFSYPVISILAHENFHIWNPYKFGGEHGTAMSWFTEGFTGYYTDLILFRSGFISLSEYVDHTNEKLRKYELSPARNISNAELTARHESDRSLSDVAGEHGMVVALWLDSHIRQQTKNRASLDSVMLKLIKEGRASGFHLTIDRIIHISAVYLTPNDRRLLRQYIEDGSTIPVPEFALAPCVRIRTESAFQFELGFEEESVRTTYVVSGVKPDSEAFKAGVREGQKITRVSVSWNDISKPVRLTVRSSDGDHSLEYYPRGPSREIQQYYLDVNCSR